MKDHDNIRAQNAEQLVQLMRHLQIKYSCPVFAFGDMNATVNDSVFDVYSVNKVGLLYDLAPQKDSVCSVHGDPVRGSDGLFHGTKATEESVNAFRKLLRLPEAKNAEGYFSSIDHIVAIGENFNVERYCVIEDQDALDVSDHSPVYADIQLLPQHSI